MIGVTVNALAVFLGAGLGVLFKRYIQEKYLKSIMRLLSLYIVVLGIDGAIKSKEPLQVIFAIILGSIIGEALDIDGKIKVFGDFIQKKLKASNPSFSRGFITTTMFICTGSMAIIGSLNAALQGNMSVLYIKSVLDFASCLVFASIYGSGVILSGIVLFIYQGFIYVLAGSIQPILTPEVINEISATGSVLLIALGLDLLEIKKFKVANYLPVVFMPLVFYGAKMLFNL